jgi:hypothetical protein
MGLEESSAFGVRMSLWYESQKKEKPLGCAPGMASCRLRVSQNEKGDVLW